MDLIQNTKMISAINNGRCNRCGSTKIIKLPNHSMYCPDCIGLGRITSNDFLDDSIDPGFNPTNKDYLEWDGQLTSQQELVVEQVQKSIDKFDDHLIWAVTGAGKTETTFPIINQALKQGKRVALAAPRVDVVLELSPRFKKAFPNLEIQTLHGRSEETIFRAQLTICTTHQLMHFRNAFDLLIIDEVDSFPFADNKQLEFAAGNATKPNSSVVYLTATPSLKLRKKINKSFLARRFHGYDLPQIKTIFTNNWRSQLFKKRPPKNLLEHLPNGRFLLFVPEIKYMQALHEILIEHTQLRGETVWSGDELRQEKIMEMRKEHLDYLITTTILERGVTLPGIDVIILGADDRNFSSSALVQIAGRVGRSKNRPDGDVLAFIEMKSDNVIQAQKEIEFMNKKAVELYG